MTYVLVAGTLFKAPDQRTSKAGKLFVTSTLKAKDGEALQWWRVTAFSESVMAELMRLAEGDALSVQGALKVEEYEKDGQKRVSLGVIADHVLALRQTKQKVAKVDRHPPQRQASQQVKPAASFDDDIPW